MNFKLEKDANEMIEANDSNRGFQEGAVGATIGGALNNAPGRSSTDTSDGMNREERRRRAKK